MKIYALRDRLVDYFLTPFCAPGDKQVLASLAAAINTVGNNDAIAQTPHHFELWELATVDEEGHITPTRLFLADAHTLIRARREPAKPEAGSGEGPPEGRRSPAGGLSDQTGTYPSLNATSPQAASQAATAPPQAPNGTRRNAGS